MRCGIVSFVILQTFDNSGRTEPEGQPIDVCKSQTVELWSQFAWRLLNQPLQRVHIPPVIPRPVNRRFRDKCRMSQPQII
jgi:hypothetical protein